MINPLSRLNRIRTRTKKETGETSHAKGKASKGKEEVSSDEAGPSGSRLEKAKSDKMGYPTLKQHLAFTPEEQEAVLLEHTEIRLNNEGGSSLNQLLAKAKQEDAVEHLHNSHPAAPAEDVTEQVRTSHPAAQAEAAAVPPHNSRPVAQAGNAALPIQNVFAIPSNTDMGRAWSFTRFDDLSHISEESSVHSSRADELHRSERPVPETGAALPRAGQLTRAGRTTIDRNGPAFEPESEIQPSSEPTPRLTRTVHTTIERNAPALGAEPGSGKSRSGSRVRHWIQNRLQGLIGKKELRSEP
jgi:hypothetical protein